MTDVYDVDKMSSVPSRVKKKKRSHNTKGICVVLDADYDKTKVEDLLSAIKLLKGVLTADFLDVGFDDHCNRSRMKIEIREQIKKGLEF